MPSHGTETSSSPGSVDSTHWCDEAHHWHWEAEPPPAATQPEQLVSAEQSGAHCPALVTKSPAASPGTQHCWHCAAFSSAIHAPELRLR